GRHRRPQPAFPRPALAGRPRRSVVLEHATGPRAGAQARHGGADGRRQRGARLLARPSRGPGGRRERRSPTLQPLGSLPATAHRPGRPGADRGRGATRPRRLTPLGSLRADLRSVYPTAEVTVIPRPIRAGAAALLLLAPALCAQQPARHTITHEDIFLMKRV